MRKKIGVVRGLFPRVTQAEFASSFEKLDSKFIAGEASQEVLDFLQKKGIKYQNLKLKPIYGFDPVKFFLGQTNHRSWVGLEPKSLFEAVADCDVLETYEAFHFFSGQAAEIAKKQGKPLVCEIWTGFTHPALFIPPYSFSVRKVMSQTDLFVLRSTKSMDFLKPLGVSKSKLKLIHHGVNLERFKPLKKNWEGVRILFVGGLNQQKGIDDLIRAFAKLNKQFPKKLSLRIAGSGPLESKIKSACREMPIEYLGHVSHLKLPKIYATSDIFCGPSRSWRYFGLVKGGEMFGYVFIEAMASGLPIVTCDCGAIPEVVGNKNLIVEQASPDKLYIALKKLIKDKQKRKELGKANRKRAEKFFSLKKQTAILEKEILKLL